MTKKSKYFDGIGSVVVDGKEFYELRELAQYFGVEESTFHARCKAYGLQRVIELRGGRDYSNEIEVATGKTVRLLHCKVCFSLALFFCYQAVCRLKVKVGSQAESGRKGQIGVSGTRVSKLIYSQLISGRKVVLFCVIKNICLK